DNAACIFDFNSGHLGLEMKLNSLRAQNTLEQIRELEIEAHGNARQKFQYRHFAPEAVPNRTKLEPDCASADNHNFFWCLVERERLCAAHNSFPIELRER